MNIKAIKILLAGGIAVLFLTSCSSLWEEIAQTEPATDTDAEHQSEERKDKKNKEETADRENASNLPEIPIDFPFPYGREEYTLTLVPSKQAESDLKTGEAREQKAGEYEEIAYDVKFCDEKGQVIQQFPCCQIVYTGNGQSHTEIPNIEEMLRFSYDDLTGDGYLDLQIFSEDGTDVTQDEAFSGLLFAYDWKEHKFTPNAIKIPTYDENKWGGMLVSRENGDYLEKFIYQAIQDRGKCILLRQWTLQKSAETLKIWDCIKARSLFDGKVSLGEDKEPVNAEYYQTLFWDKLPILRDYAVDSKIITWIEGEDYAKSATYQNIEGFEFIQRTVFGNNGRTAEYPDRQTFLEDFGFWETEPFYEYYDAVGNLQLELYFEPSTKKGCGIRYEYYYTSNLEKQTSMHGFVFDDTYKDKWQEKDVFSTKSWQGTDGADSVTEYEEQQEYRQDGRPDYYKSQGIVDWVSDDELMTILAIDWIYRDDGTLYRKNYNHNSFIFSTSCSYIKSRYDEAGRLAYEDSYITHGSVDDYYIYQDNGKKPAYYLRLDDNLGYYIPLMREYE